MNSNTQENSRESAPPTSATNRQKRIIFFSIGLLIIMATITATLVMRHQRNQRLAQERALHAQYARDLGKVMDSFGRLEKTIATGVSFFSYNQHLNEIVTLMQDLVSKYPVDYLPPTRLSIHASIDDYLLARECFQRKNDNRFAFVDTGSIDNKSRALQTSDPLYQKLIERFPGLAGNLKEDSLDLDLAMKTVWQSAQQRISETRAKLSANNGASDNH